MSNQIQQSQSGTSHILRAAQEDAGFSKMLKFKSPTGDYWAGGEIVPLGSEFIAHCGSWAKAWVKFVDGAFVDRHIYHMANGEQPADREDLGDLDTGKWRPGLDGRTPQDPWQLQSMLRMEQVGSGDFYDFVTPSIGGKRAVGELCGAWARRNNGNPIVKLQRTEMQTRFGRKWRPRFEITGWDQSSVHAHVPPPELPPAGSAADMDDEIPF